MLAADGGTLPAFTPNRPHRPISLANLFRPWVLLFHPWLVYYHNLTPAHPAAARVLPAEKLHDPT
jgi:hypothetical protein